MNSKQQEELITVLNLAQNALGYYIDDRCREEEYMWYEVLDGELDILEAFGEESEAQETVKLIRGLIASIDKEEEKGYLPDYPTRVNKLEKKITKGTEALIKKIKNR